MNVKRGYLPQSWLFTIHSREPILQTAVRQQVSIHVRSRKQMFESISAAPPDAILGLNEAFKSDASPDKINLGVGVFKDKTGVTPVLKCVKEAERRLLELENSKAYLPINGHAQYGEYVPNLLFADSVDHARTSTIQTPGGTGALRIAGDFIRTQLPGAKIWMSDPTWANHPNVFGAAGLDVKKYGYFDAATNSLNYDAMLSDLKNVPAGDVVLLHGCCHNPTGVDPSIDQWKEVGAVLAERNVLPLVDFAYQGFADGLEPDASGLRALLSNHDELLVCSSFSKNFGLYRERVGALVALSKDAATASSVMSQLKRTVRTNYSNPPSHGASIVATVLGDAELTSQWHQELADMRDRINGNRDLLVEQLAAAGIDKDFSFIQSQRGMFSFSGLTKDQVDKLKNEFSIYIVGSGRINVAGITEDNVQYLCESIAKVI